MQGSRTSHRAVVIGPVNVDLFMRGTAPLNREQLNSWVGPSDVDVLVAGSVGYTVQAFERLGVHVELCTSFGDDAFGAYLKSALETLGVGTALSRVQRGETAIAIYILMFGGSKRPMTYRLPDFEAWPDPIPLGDLSGMSLVHCGGLLHFPELWHRGLASAFQRARDAGVMTALDPQFPLTDVPAPWLRHLDDVLPHVDVLLCDELESRRIFDVADPKTAVDAALHSGPRLAVVKLGERGALIGDGHTLFHQPAVALPPDEVRDSVGAGDAFDAGFLTSLLRGSRPAEAARYATAAAAVTLTGRGGAERINDEAVATELARVPPADDLLRHA